VQVLVVDDDRAIRETIRLALEEEDYTVAEAGDGAAALRLLRDDLEPRVVLLDLRMPRLGGMGVLREAAGDPELQMRNAFVLVTANLHTLDSKELALLDELRVPAVAKPFELDELLAVVAAAAYRIGPERPGSPPSAHPS
jgi:CheY-like chemotaxis protein